MQPRLFGAFPACSRLRSVRNAILVIFPRSPFLCLYEKFPVSYFLFKAVKIVEALSQRATASVGLRQAMYCIQSSGLLDGQNQFDVKEGFRHWVKSIPVSNTLLQVFGSFATNKRRFPHSLAKCTSRNPTRCTQDWDRLHNWDSQRRGGDASLRSGDQVPLVFCAQNPFRLIFFPAG